MNHQHKEIAPVCREGLLSIIRKG